MSSNEQKKKQERESWKLLEAEKSANMKRKASIAFSHMKSSDDLSSTIWVGWKNRIHVTMC